MDFVVFNSPNDTNIQRFRAEINTAAIRAEVPPCLLAAIVQHESNGRNILQEGMQPGPDCGVGLCQITYGVDWSDPANPKFNGYDLFEPISNLYVAANFFLGPAISECKQAQINWPDKFNYVAQGQICYAAAAVYNAGYSALQKALDQSVDVDNFTTNNYAHAVFAEYLHFLTESHK